jgi:hypothetical protein
MHWAGISITDNQVVVLRGQLYYFNLYHLYTYACTYALYRLYSISAVDLSAMILDAISVVHYIMYICMYHACVLWQKDINNTTIP